jgi:hypothetical protein
MRFRDEVVFYLLSGFLLAELNESLVVFVRCFLLLFFSYDHVDDFFVHRSLRLLESHTVFAIFSNDFMFD